MPGFLRFPARFCGRGHNTVTKDRNTLSITVVQSRVALEFMRYAAGLIVLAVISAGLLGIHLYSKSRSSQLFGDITARVETDKHCYMSFRRIAPEGV